MPGYLTISKNQDEKGKELNRKRDKEKTRHCSKRNMNEYPINLGWAQHHFTNQRNRNETTFYTYLMTTLKSNPPGAVEDAKCSRTLIGC